MSSNVSSSGTGVNPRESDVDLKNFEKEVTLNENNFHADYTHNLHKKCLLKWFESHIDCPVC